MQLTGFEDERRQPYDKYMYIWPKEAQNKIKQKQHKEIDHPLESPKRMTALLTP